MERHSKKSVKVAQPDLYYGERDKLEEWLMQVELYITFEDSDITVKKKVPFAISYLRGRAQKWVSPFWKQHHDDDEDNVPWMDNFYKFKEEIRRMFGVTNETGKATRIIQHITQKKSAAEYSAQFRQYATETDWDDAALMTMYRRGLKENVKDELTRSGAALESLEDLEREAIRIDDDWYERAMEKRHDGGFTGGTGLGRSGFFPRPHSGAPRVDPYGPTPMELDAFERDGAGSRRPGRQNQNRKGQKKAFKCYGCGKPGHFARDCRSKDMVSRPQINVMERVSTKEPSMKEKVELTREAFENAVKKSEQAIDSEDRARGRIPEANVHPRWSDPALNGLFKRQEEVEKRIDARIAELEQEYEETKQKLRELIAEDDSGSDLGESSDQDQDRQLDPNEIRHSEDEWETLSDNPESCVPVSPRKKNSHEEEEQGVKKIPTEVTGDCRYDSLHPFHDKMHWTACSDNNCYTHYSDHQYAYLPRATCGNTQWNSCREDECPWHLVSKRVRKTFPGHGKEWQQWLNNPIQYDGIKEECSLPAWYYCLHPGCKRHRQEKTNKGLLPDSGKDWTLTAGAAVGKSM